VVYLGRFLFYAGQIESISHKVPSHPQSCEDVKRNALEGSHLQQANHTDNPARRLKGTRFLRDMNVLYVCSIFFSLGRFA
jgi:hypothetical protein